MRPARTCSTPRTSAAPATTSRFGVALDASGNAYVTGRTTSTDFPVSGTPLPGDQRRRHGRLRGQAEPVGLRRGVARLLDLPRRQRRRRRHMASSWTRRAMPRWSGAPTRPTSRWEPAPRFRAPTGAVSTPSSRGSVPRARRSSTRPTSAAAVTIAASASPETPPTTSTSPVVPARPISRPPPAPSIRAAEATATATSGSSTPTWRS